MRYFKLVNWQPVPCELEDILASSEGFSTRILFSSVGGMDVSTVFLSMDHSWNLLDEPLLFETMTFDRDELVHPSLKEYVGHMISHTDLTSAIVYHNDFVFKMKVILGSALCQEKQDN